MEIKVELLKQKLLKNLSNKKLQTIYNIINREHKVSLRIIEWFVSHYACEKKISYKLNDKDFNIYKSYKEEQLYSYNKKLFDMYRRMDKFSVKLKNGKILETTVAQLNFFTWFFKNKVLESLEKNLDGVRQDLYNSKTIKKTKKDRENIVITRSSILINLS